MGQPAFQLKELIRRHDVRVYSSNYALYGDMSCRVMQTLSRFAPAMEIYSIDEAFLELSGFSRLDLTEYGRRIKSTVEQWTGIPISVGIASTKTLAKIANRLAKRSARAGGVLDLTRAGYLEAALEAVAVGDIWGIGRRQEKFLRGNGIETALELKNADRKLIGARMGIVGLRLLDELNGDCRYPLEWSPSLKRSVTVSRSFNNEIRELEKLSAAVAAHVSTGARKLRSQRSVAGVLTVYLMTNRFREDDYYHSATINLPVRSSYTAELIGYALKGLRRIYHRGRGYKKAGILLGDLGPEERVQASFFDTVDRPQAQRLMRALDAVNDRLGCGTVRYGIAGFADNPAWKPSGRRLSKACTTSWQRLPEVYCQ
jgi:DNA polymerase V